MYVTRSTYMNAIHDRSTPTLRLPHNRAPSIFAVSARVCVCVCVSVCVCVCVCVRGRCINE